MKVYTALEMNGVSTRKLSYSRAEDMLIQINYIGSGGHGKSLLGVGNKQIGRNMLNDLEDRVVYAKTLDFIDKNKIATYGDSYGGLSTLDSLVKTPDLYTCGVDYVGVSNLYYFL